MVAYYRSLARKRPGRLKITFIKSRGMGSLVRAWAVIPPRALRVKIYVKIVEIWVKMANFWLIYGHVQVPPHFSEIK